MSIYVYLCLSMSIYVYLCLSFRRDTTPIEAKSQTEGAYIVQQQETTVGGGWLQEKQIQRTDKNYNRNQLNTVITHETS